MSGFVACVVALAALALLVWRDPAGVRDDAEHEPVSSDGVCAREWV